MDDDDDDEDDEEDDDDDDEVIEFKWPSISFSSSLVTNTTSKHFQHLS